MYESNVDNVGAVGNLDLNFCVVEDIVWMGARGETMYTPLLLNGGIALAISKSMSSRAILSTNDIDMR
jgi:hypothetical protein